MIRWFKKLIGNWWMPALGSMYYHDGCWVPMNRYKKMVLEPYDYLEDVQLRCDELNGSKPTKSR